MARTPGCRTSNDPVVAGSRLLTVYADLAERREHLLHSLLGGRPPRQWAHYPESDAIDALSGYQWFYHSHAPEDRRDAAEHGHIHLFARRKLWSRRLRSAQEVSFSQMKGGPEGPVNTRHLLSVGFDAKGLPISLFTVNSWVTGDLMLSAATTAGLLDELSLETGYSDVDRVITSVVRLYRTEIRDLLARRDTRLKEFDGENVLSNESLEILSECAINVDARLAAIGIV